MESRIEEILAGMSSFSKKLYSKQEVLPELLKLQNELVNLTFNNEHAQKGDLRIWDVETHLDKLNEECGHIVDGQLDSFKNDCKVICNIIKAEMSGQAGERKAFKSLETLRCKHIILKNIEFVKGDHRTELDAIVITEKAVFIIEVKNTIKDIVIDERGNYCRRCEQGLSFDKNIGENMNEKEYLLREALSLVGIENIKIINLVVFTNSGIWVENNYPYINTCYLSNLPHKVSNYYSDTVYSGEDMKKMMDAVIENRCHDIYPLPIDMAAFKRKFAVIMAKLEEKKEGLTSKVENFEMSGDFENITVVSTVTSGKDKTKENSLNKVQQWYKGHKVVASILLATSGAVVTAAAFFLGTKKIP